MNALIAKCKRLAVDGIAEPLLSRRMLEAYVVFWGKLVRRIRKPFIVGVTGSVGKSTTTAMIASVLSSPVARALVGEVKHTRENMNDDLGLAATLLRVEHFYVLPWAYPRRLVLLFTMPLRALRVLMSRYPKVMVLEFGVGSTAHFERLVAIAPPDVAIVTKIGAAHLEKLKTLEGVVREKGKLVQAVHSSGLVVLGEDHEYVAMLEEMARAPVVKVSGPGLELSRNIARVVARHMGVPAEDIASTLKAFANPKGRLNRLELCGMTVIDDTYNANPLSMRLGLDTLAEIAQRAQRRVAVLGYMAELGEDGPRYHLELGSYARTRADVLIGIGEPSRQYEPDHWFDSSDACARSIDRLLRPGDVVLVKGSWSSQTERVVMHLREVHERRERSAANA